MMNAIFKYPGSKWAIAQWVVDHFPDGYERMIYLEPFAGSLAVFFNKAPSSVEVINDIDSDVVNLFRVLRERPEDMERMILLTPFSREEYDLAFEATEDPLEKARRFLVRANMGIGSRRCGKPGWHCRVSKDPGGSVEIFEGDICQYPDCYSAAGEIEEVVSTGEVKWDEDRPSFYLTNSLGVEWHTIWEYAYEMTVVGNVHDNPGLLEY